MPWKERHVMDERLPFIARLLDGEQMAASRRQTPDGHISALAAGARGMMAVAFTPGSLPTAGAQWGPSASTRAICSWRARRSDASTWRLTASGSTPFTASRRHPRPSSRTSSSSGTSSRN